MAIKDGRPQTEQAGSFFEDSQPAPPHLTPRGHSAPKVRAAYPKGKRVVMVAQTHWTSADTTPTHEVTSIGRWLTLHTPWLPGDGAFVIDSVGVVPKIRAPEDEDFLAAQGVRAYEAQRALANVGDGEVFAARARGWIVRPTLRSDGRWRIVAMRVSAGRLEDSEFEPDLIDFVGWLRHLS